MVVCWSAKGGQGTSVVACALALVLARRSLTGGVLVDLAGDAPAVAGLVDDGLRPGVAEWTREGAEVPSDGLARLEVAAGHGLALLPRGTGPFAVERAHALRALLAKDTRPVVVDAGVVLGNDFATSVAAGADTSLLVMRSCFLAMKRAMTAPVRPSGIVLVVEEGRALSARDIEDVLHVPVCAEVQVTAQVARAVDAGMLALRLPRSLEHDVRHAA